MRAVVETQDIAPAGNGSCSAIFAASLRMVGNGLHARNQPFRRFLMPITGKQRPHDRAVAKFASHGNDPRLSQSKRRAKPLWGRAERIGNRVVAETQLNSDFSAGEPEKIWVCFGVIADKVSTPNGFLNQFWTLAHVSPNQEKCCPCVVTVEKVKQFGRDRRIRSIVKGDSQFARRVGPANGSSKKLRAGIRRAVGRQARTSSGKRRRPLNEPEIHPPILACNGDGAATTRARCTRASTECVLLIGQPPVCGI